MKRALTFATRARRVRRGGALALAIAVVVITSAAAGCAGPLGRVDSASDREAPAEPAMGVSAEGFPPGWRRRVLLKASQFGRILADARGQAMYMFAGEEHGRPRCYGDCALAWPPVLTSGEPEPQHGIDPDLLGTVERRSGAHQVTYNEHPLYYYANEAPGEVTAHRLDEYGDRWHLLDELGDPHE